MHLVVGRVANFLVASGMVSSLVLGEHDKSDDTVAACVGALVHLEVSNSGVPDGVEPV